MSDKARGIISVQSPWNDLCSAKQSIFSLKSQKERFHFDVIQATYQEYLRCGMYGYVSKPFEEDKLYRIVTHMEDWDGTINSYFKN